MPLGDATDGFYSVKTNQVGIYDVKYISDADDSAAYTFRVNVSLDEDYFLKVDNNGASVAQAKPPARSAALTESAVKAIPLFLIFPIFFITNFHRLNTIRCWRIFINWL